MREDRPAIDPLLKEKIWGRAILSPTIDLEKCKGCNTCVMVCPLHVLELQAGKSTVVYGDNCYGCGQCWAVCPTGAVTLGQGKPIAEKKPGAKPAVSPESLQLLLEERRSVRLFQQKPVPKEAIEQVIEAGSYAPTASNRQDVQYIVVGSVEGVNELRKRLEVYIDKLLQQTGSRIGGAIGSLIYSRNSVNLLRCYKVSYSFIKEKNRRFKEKDRGFNYFPLPYGSVVLAVHAKAWDRLASFNCAMALYGCALKAHTLGLGSCFLGFLHVGANQDRKIRTYLNIPKGHECYGAMVLGYPDVTYQRLIERPRPEIQWR